MAPRPYIRVDGEPVREVIEVSSEGFVPPFTLVVENDGSVGSGFKVTSAQVVLDDVTVFGPAPHLIRTREKSVGLRRAL